MDMSMSMANIETINIDLECLVDNLNAVHIAMEEDGGANWKSMCNAVYSAWRQLRCLQKELAAEIDTAYEEAYKQKAGV